MKARLKRFFQPSVIYLLGSIGVFVWSFWIHQWYLKSMWILFTVAFYLLYLKTRNDGTKKEGK